MIKKILICIFIVCFVSVCAIYMSKGTNYSISKYSNCELGDLVGEDVDRIVYKKFNIDYHTDDFTKTQIENFAKECINEGVKTQYQMDCCMAVKMYPDY